MNGVAFLWIAVISATVAATLGLFRRATRRHEIAEGSYARSEAEQRRAVEALERRSLQLQSALDQLYRTNAGTDFSIERWASILLEAACGATGAEQAVIFHADPVTQSLQAVSAKGISPATLDSLCIQPGVGEWGTATRAAEATLSARSPEGSELRAPLIGYPLWVQGEPAGFVILAHFLEGNSSLAIDRLRLLMQQATLSLANLNLQQSLHTSYAELVQTLARAIEARDLYTHGHSKRTQALARALGEENHLPSTLILHIEYGALLHDLGKLGIDDSILRKPGKLTVEEYEMMKQHPAIGFRMLKPIEFLRPASAIVLYHQEWFDGAGYPEGLAGEEIPVGARLVSVIDAWDAMTSDRPYRRAMPRSAAVAELRRQAGTQFDPRMVDAFLRVLDRLDREGVPVIEAALHAQ